MTEVEIATKFAELDGRLNGHERRLKSVEELQKDIQTLTISVHDLAISVKNLTEEQREQSARLRSLEDTPKEKWKLVVKTTITALASAFVGYLLRGGM